MDEKRTLRSQVFEEEIERIFWEATKEKNWKPEEFAAEETKKEQSVFSSIDVERIFWKVMKENNWKPEDFAAEETNEEGSISSSIDVVHSESRKNHLMNQVQVLQIRMNNLIIQKRKTSFALPSRFCRLSLE